MAGGQPTDPRALHADLRILAEPGRGLVRDHREAGHPPWNLRIGTRPHRQDPSVHQRLEQPMPPIRVDQDGRPNPHESQPSKELTHGPLATLDFIDRCRTEVDSRGVQLGFLGSLTLDGVPAALPRRDRVVLAVLAMRTGDAVSAERLADALWSDQLPASWAKVVQGCIVRLR